MDGKETTVKVSLRVRPLVPHEKANKCGTILSYPGKNQIVIGKDRAFTFDYVFDEETTQFHVYNECVAPLVSSYLDGYNATILAYGQTGSGKTFTMGTASSREIKEEVYGIVPRVIRELFQTIKDREDSTMYTVKVVFLEIYNDDIIDLLYTPGSNVTSIAARGGAPAATKGPPVPTVREMPDGSISVTNVVEEEVKSYESMMGVLERGTLNRTTGATLMNKESSRSHAIFTVLLSQRKIVKEAQDGESKSEGLLDPESDEVITSKFHFVDLAGSERLKRTGAQGARMNEGININYGLMALGNVISALADEKRRGAHVPFRDSKITRLLQDSLGGNSQTLMIACISPADINFEESLNTLKYANRAKNIKNKPVINRDPNSAKMAQMRARILELEAQLALQGGGDAPPPSGVATAMVQPEEMMMLKVQNETFETEIKRLNQRLKDVREQLSEISDKLVLVETERDSYKLKLQRVAGSDAVNAGAVSTSSLATSGSTEGAATRIGFELGIDNGEIGVMQQLHQAKHKLQKKLKRKSSALDSALSLIERYQARFGDLAPLRNSGTSGAAGDDDAAAGGGSDKEDGDDSDGGASRRRLRKLNGGSLTSGRGSSDDSEMKDEELNHDSEEDEDNDINALKEEAARKERDLSGVLSEMKRTQDELESDINDKTDLLQELTKAREHAQFMRRQYEAKITEMQNERSSVLAERDRALSNVKNDEKATAVVVAKYEKQLKSLEAKLNEMKKKIVDNDRLKRLYAADEAKIKQLNEEISATKKRMVELTRQKAEKIKEHREWVTDNNAKMKTILRENETNRALIKKMKSDLDKQSALVKRRNEEKAQLQKKLDKLAAAPKRAPATAVASSGAAAAMRNNFMRAASSNAAAAPAKGGVASGRPRHRRNVSDSKVDAYDDSDVSPGPSSRTTTGGDVSVTDIQTQLEKEIEEGVRNLEARDELVQMQDASRLLDETQRDLEQKLLTSAPQETVLEWQDSLMFCKEERGFLAKRMEAKRKELEAYQQIESNGSTVEGTKEAARIWQRVKVPPDSRQMLKFLVEQVVDLKHRKHRHTKDLRGIEKKLSDSTEEVMRLQAKYEAARREWEQKFIQQRRESGRHSDAHTTGDGVLSRLSRGDVKDAGMLHIMQNFKGVASPSASGLPPTSSTAAYNSRRSMATALSPPSTRTSRQSGMLGTAASPTRSAAAAGAAGSAGALSTLSASISSTLLTLLSNSSSSLLAGSSMSNSSPSADSHSLGVDLDVDSNDGDHGPFVPSPPRNLALTNSAAVGGSSSMSSSVASSTTTGGAAGDDEEETSETTTSTGLGGARLSAGGSSSGRGSSGNRGSSGTSGPRFMQPTASSLPKSKPPTPAVAQISLLPATSSANNNTNNTTIAGGVRRNSKGGLEPSPNNNATTANPSPHAGTPLHAGHLFPSASFDEGSEASSHPESSPPSSSDTTPSTTRSSGSHGTAALSDAELLDDDDEELPAPPPTEGSNLNVFERLLDPSKFTGMHKHIHGDKKLHPRASATTVTAIRLPNKGSKDNTTPSGATSSAPAAPRPGEWRPPTKASAAAAAAAAATNPSVEVPKDGNTPRPANSKERPAWVDNPVGVGAISQESGTKRFTMSGPIHDGTAGEAPANAAAVVTPPDSVYARLSDPRGFTGAHRVKHAAHADRSRRPGSMTQFPPITELQPTSSASAVTTAAKPSAPATGSMAAPAKTSSVKKGPTGKTGAARAASGQPAATGSGGADVPTVKAPASLFPLKLGGMTITPGPAAAALAANGGGNAGGGSGAGTSTTPSNSSQLAAAAAAGGAVVFTPLTPSNNGTRQSTVFSFSTSSATTQSPPRPVGSSTSDDSSLAVAAGKENKNPSLASAAAASATAAAATTKVAPSTPPHEAPLANVGAMSPVPAGNNGGGGSGGNSSDLWQEWNTAFGETPDKLDDEL